jgi:hypothetical protein
LKIGFVACQPGWRHGIVERAVKRSDVGLDPNDTGHHALV